VYFGVNFIKQKRLFDVPERTNVYHVRSRTSNERTKTIAYDILLFVLKKNPLSLGVRGFTPWRMTFRFFVGEG
jgi:hypothetical protein